MRDPNAKIKEDLRKKIAECVELDDAKSAMLLTNALAKIEANEASTRDSKRRWWLPVLSTVVTTAAYFAGGFMITAFERSNFTSFTMGKESFRSMLRIK